MNASSSLSKYAPKASDYTPESQWRVVSNSEGLQYIATNFTSLEPEIITHLRVRVNLGMSDSSVARLNRIKRFFKALQTYKHCKVLDLGHCQVSNHTCRLHLGPMLQINKFITDLRLNNNAFTDEGAQIVFVSLTESSVKKLKLANNDLTNGTIENGMELIRTDHFEELDFSHTKIGAHGIKLLAPELEKLKKLKKLLLENCRIGDEGCLEMAKSLGLNKSLTTLNLDENHIGRVGVEKLVENFNGKNKKLTSLSLSKNYFGNEGFEHIKVMMKVNDTLKVLKCNKVGLTTPMFVGFCEMMEGRYSQEFGPYPELEQLHVGFNGLGNFHPALFSMLRHKNCIISTLGYDMNEVTNYGAKLFKKEMVDKEGISKRLKPAVSTAGDTTEIKDLRTKNAARRNNFTKLTLKLNLIDGDGCEHLSEVVKKVKTFSELDLRKNKIGVSGAIWFKKAFRTLQCKKKTFNSVGRSFKFHILPADVTIEGVNHLAIGIREHPKTLRKLVEQRKFNEVVVQQDGVDAMLEVNNEVHKYKRSKALQRQWDKNLNVRIINEAGENGERVIGESKNGEDDNIKNKFAPLFNRKKFISSENMFHLGQMDSQLSEFNTPQPSKKKGDRFFIKGMKYGVEICGDNDEKENTWINVTKATYTSTFISVNDRNIFKWNTGVWAQVKKGWGCVLANTLYRHGLLLRLKYHAESLDYIKDLYLYRYGKNSIPEVMSFLDKPKITKEGLIARFVVDDTKLFWETLMHQTCKASEGLTMFEFVIKYADSPVIDVVRQFLNVFPAKAYSHPKSTTPAVFLQQLVAHSGKTYRDLCLSSKDRFVRRYAQAKKLILFRFKEIEAVYISKFVRITKVEDLLLTEEYNNDERFFYMRRIAATGAQADENLSDNEFNAHKNFMDNGKYLSGGGKVTIDKVENVILVNKNVTLDVDFFPQISQMFHRKQLLGNDALMPTFTAIYKTNLREVLDNESLAGGRDLNRAQILLKMIALGLQHFNEKTGLTKTNRCHGNVKPRNIILSNGDELPDLDAGTGYMPGKWVLSDFTRSTEHGKEYFPAANSAYNPPEVAKRHMSTGEHHVKRRIEASDKIDIWQFGCVLFEVLSGTTLFKTEGNNDLIIDEEERGELVNWLALDDERASLILNQLKARNSNKSHSLSVSLNNWGNYDDEEIKNIIDCGKQLVQWCLQGDPSDRPTFAEVLAHPFLASVDVGRKLLEQEADTFSNLVPVDADKWSNSGFLARQPHVHLVNTDFDQAGVVVKSIEEHLTRVGCEMTTDSITNVSPKEYQELIKGNVQNARIIVCLLTRDCFFKPNVVKQLLFAEDYRRKAEKRHARILFLDLTGKIDLTKDNLTWDKTTFSKNWEQSDEFQYLIEALAVESPSLSKLSLNGNNHNDKFDAWNILVKDHFRTMVLSYLQDPIRYQSISFLKNPMVDRILLDGHLVPTQNISKFKVSAPAAKNYKDKKNLLNKKLEDRKGKFLDLYFLPSNKVKHGSIRTYVLCAKGEPDETFNAVSSIARSLESNATINKVNAKSIHKEASDPRNKLFNKVKTSYTLKKDSHLKVGGRASAIQNIKDSVLNISREEGSLLVVLYCSAGVFKRYGKFLTEAVEKRGDDLSIILVASPGFKMDTLEEEIEANVPKMLQDRFKNKNAYIPYFKNTKNTWEHEAFMDTVLKEAVHKIENPTPRETFTV